LQALEAGMRIVADLADLGIAWPFGGSITTKSYIASHPETVRGYVKAYTEAVYLLRTDRERSIAVLQKGGQVDDPATFVKRLNELVDEGVPRNRWMFSASSRQAARGSAALGPLRDGTPRRSSGTPCE
jgi:ABC-type nitrate/sulfonate/bicarbonate transport system substrate-binding protein